MARDHKLNFENCNHSMSRKAVALGERMSARFGNAKFHAPTEYPSFESEIAELVSQEFLEVDGHGMYSRNFLIIGKGA